MRPKVLCFLIVALAKASPAFAGDRDSLDGFGPVKFGMPMSEALKILHHAHKTMINSHPQIIDSITIGDREFDIHYIIEAGRVAEISLWWDGNNPRHCMETDLPEIIRQIAAKYGEPKDHSVKVPPMPDYVWDFADGGKIKLIGFIGMAPGCKVDITYSPGGRGGF
jgi:hypothetical protein